MIDVILYEPEIPPNTGNIMRLCVNTGAKLHLVEPLGFVLDDKKLRRAGMDYREWANVQSYENLTTCLEQLQPKRLFACSTKGKKFYHEVEYQPGDALLFGPETRGLPDDVLSQLPGEPILRLPMQPESRSLNLSNSVSIFVYEARRQQGFVGGG